MRLKTSSARLGAFVLFVLNDLQELSIDDAELGGCSRLSCKSLTASPSSQDKYDILLYILFFPVN
jgi:hypothetical protein